MAGCNFLENKNHSMIRDQTRISMLEVPILQQRLRSGNSKNKIAKQDVERKISNLEYL